MTPGPSPRRTHDGDLVLLQLTAEAAGHLTMALQRHVQWARQAGLGLPAGLAELERSLANRASRGQAGSPLQDLWEVRQSEVVTPRLLTYADTARTLGVGESTVKRLVKRGDLTAVHVIGSARIAVAEIDRYIDDLTRAIQTNEGAATA